MKDKIIKLKTNPDGTTTLVSEEEVDFNIPTTEDLIKEKEEQLLSIYEEIQKLKDQ